MKEARDKSDILVLCLPVLSWLTSHANVCFYRVPMSSPQRYAIRGYTLRKNQEKVLEFAESAEVNE